LETYNSSGGHSLATHLGSPDLSPYLIMSDLWWEEVTLKKIFFEYFRFPCQFSFH
jgi:hypothetical protein